MRPVKNYEGSYSITEDGKLYSHKTNKYLKTRIHETGYKVVCIRPNGRKGKYKLLRIHRLVAEAFVPNANNKPFVNHIDGDKLNNNASNLEWVTHSENIKHAVSIGLLPIKYGTESSNSKLTKENVLYIREVYKPYDKELGARALGEKFNVHHTTIISVVNNKSYTNV